MLVGTDVEVNADRKVTAGFTCIVWDPTRGRQPAKSNATMNKIMLFILFSNLQNYGVLTIRQAGLPSKILEVFVTLIKWVPSDLTM
jgi:hypothetical protein